MNSNLPEVRPTMINVNGLRFSTSWDENIIKSGLSYKAKDDDIFVSSYQKSGTTWLIHNIFLIFNDGVPPDHEYIDNHSYPYLEMFGSEFVEKRIKPGIIKTHLPFHLQPYNPSAKYIFILRNPKDVIVSLYYHVICQPTYNYNEDFHHFFKLWLNGDFVYEDYFEFINSWWKHRGEDNFLFIFYEDMKKNQREEVLKLAHFIGEEYAEKLCSNNEEILNKILYYSSFDYMRHKQKGLPNRYVRKGVVGDWRNHFTQEESLLIDKLIKDKFNGTGLDQYWINQLKWKPMISEA